MVGAVNNQTLYTYSSDIKEEKAERPQEDVKEKGNGGATSAVSVKLSGAARQLYESGASTEEENAAASAAGSETSNKNINSGNASMDAAEEIKESLVNAIA
ncbi:MAG: hypothetical protein HQL61_02415 [Magnetococcales bacterium]|uniref:Uncharacterized protein n=1 Tax=Candidatus Magnetobacterium casense TaxID=1455061 RepID=A0ABS6S1R9_9BACT|nr:hypothetical protein [Candidatus Magnetobacterium casensis]MBF0606390.1 hypothetical protein [Nitrospirota bacterium]MBV6342792.1 hypothetical protein [Candidatus Magnetobacterium casensis]